MLSVRGQLLALFFLILTSPASAHESQPGTLEIKQIAADRYDVT